MELRNGKMIGENPNEKVIDKLPSKDEQIEIVKSWSYDKQRLHEIYKDDTNMMENYYYWTTGPPCESYYSSCSSYLCRSCCLSDKYYR